MKKFIALVLAGLMTVSLVACKSNKDESIDDSSSVPVISDSVGRIDDSSSNPEKFPIIDTRMMGTDKMGYVQIPARWIVDDNGDMIMALSSEYDKTVMMVRLGNEQDIIDGSDYSSMDERAQDFGFENAEEFIAYYATSEILGNVDAYDVDIDEVTINGIKMRKIEGKYEESNETMRFGMFIYQNNGEYAATFVAASAAEYDIVLGYFDTFTFNTE